MPVSHREPLGEAVRHASSPDAMRVLRAVLALVARGATDAEIGYAVKLAVLARARVCSCS